MSFEALTTLLLCFFPHASSSSYHANRENQDGLYLTFLFMDFLFVKVCVIPHRLWIIYGTYTLYMGPMSDYIYEYEGELIARCGFEVHRLAHLIAPYAVFVYGALFAATVYAVTAVLQYDRRPLPHLPRVGAGPIIVDGKIIFHLPVYMDAKYTLFLLDHWWTDPQVRT